MLFCSSSKSSKLQYPYTVLVFSDDPAGGAALSERLGGVGIEVLAELTPDEVFSDLLAGVDAVVGEASALPLELYGGEVPLLALVYTAEEAARALLYGAGGVVWYNADGTQLLAALGALTQGLAVLEPAFLPEHPEGAAAPAYEPLTPREREVLALLAEGLPNKAIAKRLELSEHTVKFHLGALMGKLGVTSRTEAVTRAVCAGLLTL